MVCPIRWAMCRRPTPFSRGLRRAETRVFLFGWKSGPWRMRILYFIEVCSKRRSSGGIAASHKSRWVGVHGGRLVVDIASLW